MNKIFFSTACIIMLFVSNAWACTMCGCQSSGLMYVDMGLGKNQTVGLRQFIRNYTALVHDEVDLNAFNHMDEHIQQYDALASLRLNKHLGVFASLPYVHYKLNKDGEKHSYHGLGDALLLGAYTFALQKNPIAPTLHHVSVKAGLKLPTGVQNTAQFTPLNPIGTGTLDFLYGIDYTLIKTQWVLKSAFLYKQNTYDQDGDKKGDMFSMQHMVHYQVLDKPDILVGLGSIYEQFGYETVDHYTDKLTGAYIWSLYPSIAIKVKKFTFAHQLYIPVKQDFTSHFVEQEINTQFILTYNF
jgi:hypothetical protein